MKIKREINGNEIEVELTYEEMMNAHKEVVTNWMENILHDDFGLKRDYAKEVAIDAYEIYSEGDGLTEYEATQKAYDEYQEDLEME